MPGGGNKRVRWYVSHLSLEAGAAPLQRERLPSERDICHVTSILPGCGVSPLPSMYLPPHLSTPKILLCLQLLRKTPPFEPASLGGVKGLKVVLVLKKKKRAVSACGKRQPWVTQGEKWKLFLVISLCTSVSIPCLSYRASSATCTERSRHGHAKGSFARLVPWHLDAIQWAHPGNPAGNTSHDWYPHWKHSCWVFSEIRRFHSPWQNPNETCWGRWVCSHLSQTSFFPLVSPLAHSISFHE